MARRTSRTSSRDRLNRMQAEAAAGEAEKQAKKAAKKASKTTKKTTRKTTRSRKAATPTRMKYVWQVQVKGEVVDQFNYGKRAEAAAEAASLSKETGREHEVVKAKVPMEE